MSAFSVQANNGWRVDVWRTSKDESFTFTLRKEGDLVHLPLSSPNVRLGVNGLKDDSSLKKLLSEVAVDSICAVVRTNVIDEPSLYFFPSHRAAGICGSKHVSGGNEASEVKGKDEGAKTKRSSNTKPNENMLGYDLHRGGGRADAGGSNMATMGNESMAASGAVPSLGAPTSRAATEATASSASLLPFRDEAPPWAAGRVFVSNFPPPKLPIRKVDHFLDAESTRELALYLYWANSSDRASGEYAKAENLALATVSAFRDMSGSDEVVESMISEMSALVKCNSDRVSRAVFDALLHHARCIASVSASLLKAFATTIEHGSLSSFKPEDFLELLDVVSKKLNLFVSRSDGGTALSGQRTATPVSRSDGSELVSGVEDVSASNVKGKDGGNDDTSLVSSEHVADGTVSLEEALLKTLALTRVLDAVTDFDMKEVPPGSITACHEIERKLEELELNLKQLPENAGVLPFAPYWIGAEVQYAKQSLLRIPCTHPDSTMRMIVRRTRAPVGYRGVKSVEELLEDFDLPLCLAVYKELMTLVSIAEPSSSVNVELKGQGNPGLRSSWYEECRFLTYLLKSGRWGDFEEFIDKVALHTADETEVLIVVREICDMVEKPVRCDEVHWPQVQVHGIQYLGQMATREKKWVMGDHVRRVIIRELFRLLGDDSRAIRDTALYVLQYCEKEKVAGPVVKSVLQDMDLASLEAAVTSPPRAQEWIEALRPHPQDAGFALFKRVADAERARQLC
eukprot:CAMPEP_0113888594 /NCGR_PEP_ID=MMETSP0780_2-20120614/12954_1 /TAXON_ID=652834 /ORGANISM="Palpitomonas bilix" /LENGTH=740 /DNA_ID=CAMNT_0000877451 /DNA_START=95 /DNA_END=2317 /DNA_ORIENTATION=- /assembly_acc=CAM_ASM_000599